MHTKKWQESPDDGAGKSKVLVGLRVLSPFLVCVVAYIWRQQIVTVLGDRFSFSFVFPVVHFVSTFDVRVVIAICTFVGLFGCAWLIDRFAPEHVKVTLVGLVFACAAAAALLLLRRPMIAVFVFILVLALTVINALSRQRLAALRALLPMRSLIDVGVFLTIGVEVLLPRPYLLWVMQKTHWGESTAASVPDVLRFAPGAAIAAACLAVLSPFPRLMAWGAYIFMSPSAEIIYGPEYSIWSRYDVSDIARNPENGDLLLCGDTNESPNILRAATGVAMDTGVSNHGNEFCDYSEPLHRFVTVNQDPHDLLVIDPVSLAVEARVSLGSLPPGEILLASHPKLNLVVAASENALHLQSGPEVRIIDTSTLSVTREISAQVGYVITHPVRPVMYVNHFAFDSGVRAYDMQNGELLGQSPLFGRSDRMIFDIERNEVLATAPEGATIHRFDAETLEQKTPIHTVYGVRGLAIDYQRDLLLTSSFITNMVEVLDLKTGQSLRRYRVGPWMRDIHIVSENGVAYVASRYGLYRLNYLE